MFDPVKGSCHYALKMSGPTGSVTLAPILGAVEKQDIMNLRTLLGSTRIVAVLVNPVFDYESKLLSVVR